MRAQNAGYRTLTIAGDAPTTVALFHSTAAADRVVPMGPWLPIVASGAPASDAKLTGLIVIAHGTGGTELNHHNLGTRLARDGYLVAAVRHAGDNVLVSLRWSWEIEVNLGDVQCSVFEVPRQYVKGRRSDAYVVCNSAAQFVVDAVREQHAEFVFVRPRELEKNLDDEPLMPYQPIHSINNTAWQTARRRAGLGDLHVHDLRHTVGVRLREAGVDEDTRADILWHKRPGMTAHYSQAQVRESRMALELIRDETGPRNRSLRSLAREAREGRANASPFRVPSKEKTP